MPPLFSSISDPHLALILPILVHWLTSAFFEICERTGWLEEYRLHTTEEELSKNRVTRRECLRVTIQCQVNRIRWDCILATPAYRCRASKHS